MGMNNTRPPYEPLRDLDEMNVTVRPAVKQRNVGSCTKLRLVLWKNWLLRKRQFIMTPLEIIIPALLSMLLVVIRNVGGDHFQVIYHENFTSYPSEPVLRDIYVRTNWTVLYTPQVCRNFLTYYESYPVNFIGVENDEEMNAWSKNHSNVLVGISCLNLNTESPISNKFHYRVRIPIDARIKWNTNLLAPAISQPGPLTNFPDYTEFLVYQHLVAVRFMELLSEKQDLNRTIQLTTQKFPFPPYYEDSGFSQIMQSLMPLFICLSYVFISPTLIKFIVREKETGIKELMKIMGIPGWIQWIGWFTSSFIMMFLSAVLIVFLLCLNFSTMAVLPHTRPELLLFVLILYIASAIAFCCFIASFFSKPTLATAIGVIVWMLSFSIPYNLLDKVYPTLDLSIKLLTMLLPNMAMAWACRFIIAFEGQNLGLQWNNLDSPSFPGDNMTMIHIMIMMVVNLFFYSFLTWYMDHVFPGIYGIKKKPYFFLTKSYWRSQKLNTSKISPTPTALKTDISKFEAEPRNLNAEIVIKGLTKTFNGKIAVDGINLNIFEGQITALLGHNGAGKTTTMSMVTGLFPPTSGTAFLGGYDVRTDIDIARNDLGLCPQHNMLFSNLTVNEHLKFFGKLKIKSSKELKLEITTLLQKLQLWDKRNTPAMSLSGGMKRKLNLGIALIGKPKIVILDEPTSGMDPEARRAIWDLLQEFRQGRSIVLSTHYMEEADVLGDRIAIMAAGKIECCGSPLYLKKRYGAGYHLNISKQDNCDVTGISVLVQRKIPSSYINQNTNLELSFILPSEETELFPMLFQELDEASERLGILSFGISVTTMEEVFLKVGEQLEIKEMERSYSPNQSEMFLADNRRGIPPTVQNTGVHLWWEQFCGLLLKRWYYAKRRWILLIAQVLVPIAMLMIVLWLNNRIDEISPIQPPRVMDITQYGKTKSFYKDSAETFTLNYKNSFPSGTPFKNEKDPVDFLENLGKTDFQAYTKDYIVGADLVNGTGKDFAANAWFNGLYYHTQPLSLNLIHNAMAKNLMNNNSVSITVENAPLPTNSTSSQDMGKILAIVKAIMIGVFIPVGLSFLSSSFVVFPIHERASKSKHLQLMTGIGGSLFWAASFVWDFFTHVICSLIMLLIFATMDDTETFSGGEKTGIVLLLLLLYGWSAIPFTYMISFLTRLPATGFSRLTTINLIAGIILSVTMASFQMFGSEELLEVSKYLQWLFRLLPNYTVTIALMNMVRISAEQELCKKIPFCGDTSFFRWDVPGLAQEVMMLGLCGFIYLILLALIERGVFYGLWYKICQIFKKKKWNYSRFPNEETISGSVDRDVASEMERIRNMLSRGSPYEDVLIVSNLSKQFWNFRAVDNLNFGVHPSECFGLLGINGAGKTTTFRMLTGDLLITDGNAYVRGLGLKGQRPQYLQHIGYCPQFDALIDYLTGREILQVFARLRGISSHQLNSTVNQFISKFDLTEHADKITMVYSGGNKRKLSTALAFIGDPPVIFLDEPTTGVDPVARRKIWDILTEANNSGTSVVLTSHSMEECEVLCSRLAIMVNGQFQCLGGVQYLKNRFCQGFTILAKIKRIPNAQDQQRNLQDFIQTKFPSSILKDDHEGLVQYLISDTTTKLAYLFSTMEEAKRLFDLEDYSVSQANLEQVFLSFARKQLEVQPKQKFD